MLCFQPSGSGAAPELRCCPLIPRMAVRLSLVDLNQKSECTLVLVFFSTSLLPAGNRTTNFDDISVGSRVRISSSASQELFFLVKTC